jgi:hypothetical protein
MYRNKLESESVKLTSYANIVILGSVTLPSDFIAVIYVV